jgi:dGTPase
MNWTRLLSTKRLGSGRVVAADDSRTAFQRDYDRIVFSSAFRRLQDKTQVFPLADSDFVRTRLTHSLEASCVGRSLGTLVGQALVERNQELRGLAEARQFHASDMGAIVAAACLAHDIGNPPFGHAGEDAISHWFRQSAYGREVVTALRARGHADGDFTRFEGNAQGFRVLARLEHPEHRGGMRLTTATLAAFMKYPRSSDLPPDAPTSDGVSCRKHGFFVGDVDLFREVAEDVGLLARDSDRAWYVRHPLAFLVEAADDICYHVIDLEDGFRMRLLSLDDVEELFLGVCRNPQDSARERRSDAYPGSRVGYLRAKAISELVAQAVEVFMDHESRILAGEFDRSLPAVLPRADAFQQLKEVACSQVYPAREVVLTEAAGFNVLGQLIELFLRAVNDSAENGRERSLQTRTVLKLLPELWRSSTPPAELSPYDRVLLVTDFVSSLSDRRAVSLFKRLTGISLPGE